MRSAGPKTYRFDSLSHGGTTTAYVTVRPKGRHGQARTVVFSKKGNGTCSVVEAVPDTSKKAVYVVSAYIQKEAPTSTSANAKAPRYTSETAAKNVGTPNGNIPRNTQNNKTQNRATAAKQQDSQLPNSTEDGKVDAETRESNGPLRLQSRERLPAKYSTKPAS